MAENVDALVRFAGEAPRGWRGREPSSLVELADCAAKPPNEPDPGELAIEIGWLPPPR